MVVEPLPHSDEVLPAASHIGQNLVVRLIGNRERFAIDPCVLHVHASQLYEGLLEGLVLFVILWVFTSKSRPRLAPSGLFLLCYGVFRFLVEFVRLPDQQLDYLAFGWLTMGQVLSVPLIVLGLVWLWCSRRAPTLQPRVA